MNKVILYGRLTKDVEYKGENGDKKSYCRFGIAVSRTRKEDGEYKADFFNVVAFSQQADLIAKNFYKGRPILVEGRIENKEVTKDNGDRMVYPTICVQSFDFPLSDTKKDSNEDNNQANNNKSVDNTNKQVSGNDNSSKQPATVVNVDLDVNPFEDE